jgi:2-oxoglutarate dehydrogenase E2 component (dihydrolipoamide succinyltransferase)
MMIEIKVPSPGESISEVQLASWLVEDGEFVEKDKEIAEVDSDKATLSLVAQESGVIKILVKEGETIKVGTVVATIDTAQAGKEAPKKKTAKEETPAVKETAPPVVVAVNASDKPVVAEAVKAVPEKKLETSKPVETGDVDSGVYITPLARKIMQEKQLSDQDVMENIRHLRVGKADVLEMGKPVQEGYAQPVARETAPAGREERKKMSMLRLKLAERLVAVKNETAMLTTFNEINMTALLAIKKKYNDAFKEKYGVGIGFMSFFTKAISEALLLFPQVNSMIDGDELVLHHYVDIGIAVSAPKGLVVPVIRGAENLTLAEIELNIKALAKKARENKITLAEMQGGTFTITNGGVFGSLFSTPILNPPQSAILGMHNIVERPIAVNGQVVVAPMMYVALSYDHRVIDGSESVRFLVKVKEMIEDPLRLLFDGSEPNKVLLGL